jgi:hypothetical protein
MRLGEYEPKEESWAQGTSSFPLLISLLVWASGNGCLDRSPREQRDLLTLGGAKSYHSVRRSRYFFTVPAGLRCTHGFCLHSVRMPTEVNDAQVGKEE